MYVGIECACSRNIDHLRPKFGLSSSIITLRLQLSVRLSVCMSGR